jgi:hypothetical protein
MATQIQRHWGILVIALGLISTTADAANSEEMHLCTQSDQSIGVGLSNYSYEEPQIMSLKAQKISLSYSNINALNGNKICTPDGWFGGGQLQVVVGNADYQSPISGSLTDTPNWYVNTQFRMGKDIGIGNDVFSPHIGLGFRVLYNDLRTNDLRQGYRRSSSYFYMPFGLTHKTWLQNTHMLSTTFEYMHLLQGVQRASLSDQNPNAQNVRLKQPRGYGLSIETLLRAKDWSMGPVVSYWKVEQSNVSGVPAIFEPANATLEIGFRVNRYF